ncbi:MAG: polyphosphate kinase 2 family protein [Candidatus Nanopelagicales bacterium]
MAVYTHWKSLAEPCLVPPGRTVDLDRDYDAGRKDPDLDKDEGAAALADGISQLFAYQDKFYAQADRAMLVVLQAIDAAGKDGTVKHVMTGLNPAGVDVHSFKAPSATERAHDFLWRHNLVLPELGRIGIFNRSHYENVIVTRVHPQMLWPDVPEEQRPHLWKRRYREINDWERYLTDNGTVIVKFFLHVSKKEQERRFLERIDDPAKNWKFSAADLHERQYWDDYRTVFQDMLNHTSTEWAPWYVLPADHKWFSHLSASAVLLEAMARIDPQYPDVTAQQKADLAHAKEDLLGTAGGGSTGGDTPTPAGGASS